MTADAAIAGRAQGMARRYLVLWPGSLDICQSCAVGTPAVELQASVAWISEGGEGCRY